MKAPLSDEQRRALDQEPGGIEVEDGQTQKVYFLTDAELHRRAMQALKHQEDHAAIQAGIDDEWKHSNSFSRDDIPVANELLKRAWDFINDYEQEQRGESGAGEF